MRDDDIELVIERDDIELNKEFYFLSFCSSVPSPIRHACQRMKRTSRADQFILFFYSIWSVATQEKLQTQLYMSYIHPLP
jgi:transposase